MRYIDLGNILVTLPGVTNPYFHNILGNERASALGQRLTQGVAPGYEFWVAPVYGGARRMTPEDRVDPVVVKFYWPG